MQHTTESYDQQELLKAINFNCSIYKRRLGVDANTDIKNLIDSIPRIINTVSWLLDGSYGYEYKLLCKQWLSNLPNTAKRRHQRLRSISISVFTLIACLDYPDLNPRKITSEFKKRNVDMENINQKVIYEIQTWMENHMQEISK